MWEVVPTTCSLLSINISFNELFIELYVWNRTNTIKERKTYVIRRYSIIVKHSVKAQRVLRVYQY